MRLLEDDAVGEADVADFADHGAEVVGGVALVEEVVEGHGEHEQGDVVAAAGAVGEGAVGEAEVEAPAVGEHVFVGVAPAGPAAAGTDDLVVVDTGFNSRLFAADDEAAAGLHIEGTEVLVEGLEADFLTFVVGAGIDAYQGGRPREVDAYAPVADALDGVAEGAVVGAVDAVGVGKAFFGHPDGEDEVGTGDECLEKGFVLGASVGEEVGEDAVGGVVEKVGPVVGRPGAGVEGELIFRCLSEGLKGNHNSKNYN